MSKLFDPLFRSRSRRCGEPGGAPLRGHRPAAEDAQPLAQPEGEPQRGRQHEQSRLCAPGGSGAEGGRHPRAARGGRAGVAGQRAGAFRYDYHVTTVA